MAGQLQPGVGMELDAASVATLTREGRSPSSKLVIEGKPTKVVLEFSPISTAETILFNTGLEYRGCRWLVDHEVPADYAQGILAGMCGESPVRVDAWMGGFRDSDAGWHVHGGGLRMSDGTSSSLVAGQRSTCSEDILQRSNVLWV
ncbi:hypothetical protein EDD85DRAFT_797163 [Armillaria nabsnona]|nr:hypothetical protein EDD85DRAFT_797163 [Armillaria nabsnona]